MQDDALLKRALDLSGRSLDRGMVTSTGFLTPAESLMLERQGLPNLYLYGGSAGCERRVAFFLPEYLELEFFEAEEYISVFQCSTKFAEPSHRDYLGALLGLGLERKCIGDIYVTADTALFFVLENVSGFIAQNLDRIGQHGAVIRKIPLSSVSIPEKNTQEIRFTVSGNRLDGVLSGLFNLSRSHAADMIRSGLVSLNYETSLKPDARIHEGDILSLRGRGKGSVSSLGTPTRKDRIPVTAVKYI